MDFVLVLASANVHKVRELKLLFKPLSHRIDLYSLRDFPDYIPPPEDGSTFEENATIKALHAARALKKWTLADDSGLVVPALNGAPGIFSARYAGEGATDLDNRKKLLKEMGGFEDFRRSAYFECALALASPEGLKKCVKGTCEGLITTKERGKHGFGYDPLFIKHDYQKTFAELEENVKNQISHRAKAASKMLMVLEDVLKTHAS